MTTSRVNKQAVRKIAEQQNITYMQAQEVYNVSNSPVLFKRNEDGTEAYISIEPYYYPYALTDLPVYAHIVLVDGTKVVARDFGARVTYEFSDGQERTNWVHPCNVDEVVIANKITSGQYDLLVEADNVAQRFFSLDMKSDGHDPDSMISSQLHEIIKKAIQ